MAETNAVGNDESTDLVDVKSSSENLKIVISEHRTDHKHTNECHYSKGCKFEVDAINDCLDCRI